MYLDNYLLKHVSKTSTVERMPPPQGGGGGGFYHNPRAWQAMLPDLRRLAAVLGRTWVHVCV